MIRLGTTVTLGEKLKNEEAMIGIDVKIFEVFDFDMTSFSIRSVPHGTVIIHGLRKTDVVLHKNELILP